MRFPSCLAVSSLVASLAGCGLSLPKPPPTIAVAREAPAGAFDAKSTFALETSFELWPVDAGNPGQWRVDFERGASKAEHEFRRDPFLTNPRLASPQPPAHMVQVTVDRFGERGLSLGSSATMRVVDGAGTVIEEVGIEASGQKRSGASGVAEDLGYRVALYLVCRTGGKPAASCAY